MAMFIVGSYKASPYDPDSAFDPVTHVATEAAFIQLLEHGVYDSKYIGYKVQLGNSVDYNNGLWVIADVNHDSANTGQTDCYDLISEKCFYSTAFSSSDGYWRGSKVRSFLKNTFYPGFSESFKARMLNIKYKTGSSSWFEDDKIITPSYKEVNGGTSSYQDNEGIAYPIFTDNNSRRKNYGDSGYRWWTRSRYNINSNVWYVTIDGTMDSRTYSNTCCVAPLMRVH